MPLDSLRTSSRKSILYALSSTTRHCVSSAKPLTSPPKGRGISSHRNSGMATKPQLKKQYSSSGLSPKKARTELKPSASVLLISPANEILLLRRVQTSSSFPSAYVFPGGNLSPEQDGQLPAANDPKRHEDGPVYRLAAVRECFEEGGILLARRNDGSGAFLQVPDRERERARKQIHAGELRFPDWVLSQGGVIDTDSLIPFTRWVTPANVPKRFTTQMYLAFLDIQKPDFSSINADLNLLTASEAIIPAPTSDGGIEHTVALFDYCSTWLARARANDIILFPPQLYLLSLLAPMLPPPVQKGQPVPLPVLREQRDAVLAFLQRRSPTSSTPWCDKVISPVRLFVRQRDGRQVMALDQLAPELAGLGRSGDSERVVLVRFSTDGPRDVEVRWRHEVEAEEEREKVDLQGTSQPKL